MADLMLQFHHAGGAPALDEARALFGLSATDVDEQYGVVASDRRAGLYVIMVKPQATAQVEAALARRPGHPAEGLFGNPPIAPFGPPER